MQLKASTLRARRLPSHGLAWRTDHQRAEKPERNISMGAAYHEHSGKWAAGRHQIAGRCNMRWSSLMLAAQARCAYFHPTEEGDRKINDLDADEFLSMLLIIIPRREHRAISGSFGRRWTPWRILV
ncbi:hypothetical protein KCP77_13310 [Salmonella enterica subsp. enterica]|nr:hypothetical protein KCP77_13310 [Salmonella enterica subsp. enterica]